jgi:hypothetical protein
VPPLPGRACWTAARLSCTRAHCSLWGSPRWSGISDCVEKLRAGVGVPAAPPVARLARSRSPDLPRVPPSFRATACRGEAWVPPTRPSWGECRAARLGLGGCFGPPARAWASSELPFSNAIGPPSTLVNSSLLFSFPPMLSHSLNS